MKILSRALAAAALAGLLSGLLYTPAAADPAASAPVTSLPSPEDYFGHRMGEDRKLVHYDDFIVYYDLLAQGSDRVNIERIGTTTRGRDMVLLTISSPENLARVERYREISKLLNDPRGLGESELDALIAEGKVILFVTLNIHSSEIVSSQMGMEWVHQLATGGPDSPSRYLDDVIVLLVPSVNPDGQAMVTEWYRKYVRTRYEGGPMPWLYHPYAGHDNNRDWFMLNLPETRAVNEVAYHDWFPQVLVDEHQMGATGPRAFVPPYTDPVSDKVHPLIHRGSLLIGANMSMDLEMEGMSGAIYGYSFDAYWPGGTRSTPWWKNTLGVLVEIASARVASPIYVDPGELSGGRKGLPDYQAQVNFPNPWPGGWWRPRDILDYELVISNSALKTCSLHREDFLRNRARMAMDAVRLGETAPPYGYVIPPAQHDPGTAAKLVDLLVANGLEVFYAPSDIVANGQRVEEGSYVLPAAQPFRSFLVEMMEPQVYPEVRLGPGTDEIYRPYDVTAWTLPYLMGVDIVPLRSPAVFNLEAMHSPAWNAPALVQDAASEAGPDESRGTWLMTPAQNDAYTAVMRALDRGFEVRQKRDEFVCEGETYPPGSFFITADGQEMASLLQGLRTQARRVDPRLLARPEAPGPALPPAIPLPGPESTPENPFRTLEKPRLGIYQSWLAPMDEGWTRFVLDRFQCEYTVLHNKEIQAGNLDRSFDVILLPDQNRTELVEGKRAGGDDRYEEPRPAPYDGGLGPKGVKALDAFVKKGGVLVTLGNAAELAIGDLNIPVRNVTGDLSRADFSTAGAILRAEVDVKHPLGYGMPPHALVYHTSDPVLGTQVPGPESQRTVVVRYAEGDDVLASGWADGVKQLERKAALVEASSGEGKVVLFGFRPQHRGQTDGTYRMLLNAILDGAAE